MCPQLKLMMAYWQPISSLQLHTPSQLCEKPTKPLTHPLCCLATKACVYKVIHDCISMLSWEWWELLWRGGKGRTENEVHIPAKSVWWWICSSVCVMLIMLQAEHCAVCRMSLPVKTFDSFMCERGWSLYFQEINPGENVTYFVSQTSFSVMKCIQSPRSNLRYKESLAVPWNTAPAMEGGEWLWSKQNQIRISLPHSNTSPVGRVKQHNVESVICDLAPLSVSECNTTVYCAPHVYFGYVRVHSDQIRQGSGRPGDDQFAERRSCYVVMLLAC